jgi:dTDP-4-amino-4,6-dideoxygalactose transaminase
MEWQIPLADVDFGVDEEEAVNKVIRGGWLTMGEMTQAFEREFAQYNHVNYAIAVSSCTAALHLACVVLGIGPGDEVIIPALTFVATANAVRYTGAQPVFADIKSNHDLNISTRSIEEKITERTKAIIVMHYAGYPCDMPGILKIAKAHSLSVIEDAAHAVGSSLDGRKLGTWGDIGCFSFFSNKNLVTGEGGMLVTHNHEFAERLKKLRSHGMTSLTWDRHRGHAWSYDVVDLGYNYRLDEIRSALGLVQLAKLEGNNNKRRGLVHNYREWLAELVPEISVPFDSHPGIPSVHIMPILLPETINRREFMDYLKGERIQTSIHYPPIYQFESYADNKESREYSLRNTEIVSSREVTLPMYPHLHPDQVETIVQVIREAVDA